MAHTKTTLESHTMMTLLLNQYRVNVGIKAHERSSLGSKLIVAHTMITLESHHTSIFQVRHRNQYVIEDLEIGHETGKLIVSHTVITIESHHTHVLFPPQGNPYNIRNHPRVICTGSHIFAVFYDVAHTIEGVSQVWVGGTTGR